MSHLPLAVGRFPKVLIFWFDPIEAGIRDRVREFIEEMGMTTPSGPHLEP
jgi:hypothetical protein